MKKILLLAFLMLCTKLVYAQAPSLKTTTWGSQIRSTITLISQQPVDLNPSYIKKNTWGLRWAIGVGSAFEIGGQFAFTRFRNCTHKALHSLLLSSRIRYFPAKLLFPLRVKTYQTLTLFGTLRSSTSGKAIGLYALLKSRPTSKIFAVGSVHRVNPKLALAFDGSISPKQSNLSDFDSEATAVNRRFYAIKLGVGLLYIL